MKCRDMMITWYNFQLSTKEKKEREKKNTKAKKEIQREAKDDWEPKHSKFEILLELDCCQCRDSSASCGRPLTVTVVHGVGCAHDASVRCFNVAISTEARVVLFLLSPVIQAFNGILQNIRLFREVDALKVIATKRKP